MDTAPNNQWLAQDAECDWRTITLRTTDESAHAAALGYAGTSSHTQDVWAASDDALLVEALMSLCPFAKRTV